MEPQLRRSSAPTIESSTSSETNDNSTANEAVSPDRYLHVTEDTSTPQPEPGQAPVFDPLVLNRRRNVAPVDRKSVPHDVMILIDVAAAGMCAVRTFAVSVVSLGWIARIGCGVLEQGSTVNPLGAQCAARSRLPRLLVTRVRHVTVWHLHLLYSKKP
jgi:hypothetical protein